MLFHFYITISATLNDDGTLFHPYFDISFYKSYLKHQRDTLFVFNMLSMYIKSLYLIFYFDADTKIGRLVFEYLSRCLYTFTCCWF